MVSRMESELMEDPLVLDLMENDMMVQVVHSMELGLMESHMVLEQMVNHLV